MPGGYAHIFLVNKMNDQIEALPELLQHAFKKYFHFCELGSVSPDMPYLALGKKDQMEWADIMHYERTFDFVRKATRIIHDLAGEKQLKCLSWLLGYASHLVMDGTVHPVVELKVGPYAENKKHHRKCELNQDSYIFPQLGYGEAGAVEPFDSGPRLCSDPGDSKSLEHELLQFWKDTLNAVHADHFEDKEPYPNIWFKEYVKMMDGIVEEGYKLTPLTRHLMVDLLALTCPKREEADSQYIKDLKSPSGRKHYDQVIELAIANVLDTWQSIGLGITDHTFHKLSTIPNFNLDTGKDEAGILIWWA